MLAGREVMKIQNMQYKKAKVSFCVFGSLVLFEGGIAFFKSKGAMAAQLGFGMVGAFLSRNNEVNEPEIELQYSQIRDARYCLVVMNPAIEVSLRDGSSIYFVSQSRLFNGKSDLEKAANYINSQIR